MIDFQIQNDKYRNTNTQGNCRGWDSKQSFSDANENTEIQILLDTLIQIHKYKCTTEFQGLRWKRQSFSGGVARLASDFSFQLFHSCQHFFLNPDFHSCQHFFFNFTRFSQLPTFFSKSRFSQLSTFFLFYHIFTAASISLQFNIFSLSCFWYFWRILNALVRLKPPLLLLPLYSK